MDSLPVNIFDICVILMLLVGALIGLTLGFVRGGLFVMSWIGAALATLYGFTPAQPIARKYIESEFFADLTTGVAIFLVSLVILFVMSYPQTSYTVAGINGPIEFNFGLSVGFFVALTVVLGFMMSLGKAAVYKHIPVYYPHHVGSVGGLVGMIGGLGGFFLPIAFGILLDMTGVWTAPFMLLFVLVAVSTVWMHVAIRRMERARHPALAEEKYLSDVPEAPIGAPKPSDEQPKGNAAQPAE